MTTVIATAEDMTARFGEAELAQLATLTGGDAVVNALTDATDEALSYVAVVYTPPFPSIPAPLKTAVCDMARYRLYKDAATQQVKDRYDAAVKWLVRLSKREVVLIFEVPLTIEQKETVVTPPGPVSSSATNVGVFSDDQLGRMPHVHQGRRNPWGGWK